MSKNEEVVSNMQQQRVEQKASNVQRTAVRVSYIVFWLSVALIPLSVWVLRLLDDRYNFLP